MAMSASSDSSLKSSSRTISIKTAGNPETECVADREKFGRRKGSHQLRPLPAPSHPPPPIPTQPRKASPSIKHLVSMQNSFTTEDIRGRRDVSGGSVRHRQHGSCALNPEVLQDRRRSKSVDVSRSNSQEKPRIAIKPKLRLDSAKPISVQTPRVPLKLSMNQKSEEEMSKSTPSPKPKLPPKPRPPVTPKILTLGQNSAVSIPITHEVVEKKNGSVDVDLGFDFHSSMASMMKTRKEVIPSSSENQNDEIGLKKSHKTVSVTRVTNSNKTTKDGTTSVTTTRIEKRIVGGKMDEHTYKMSSRKTMDVPVMKEHLVDITKTHNVDISSTCVVDVSNENIVTECNNLQTDNKSISDIQEVNDEMSTNVFIPTKSTGRACTMPCSPDLSRVSRSSVLRSSSLSRVQQAVSRHAVLHYESSGSTTDESSSDSENVNSTQNQQMPKLESESEDGLPKSDIMKQAIVSSSRPPLPTAPPRRRSKKSSSAKVRSRLDVDSSANENTQSDNTSESDIRVINLPLKSNSKAVRRNQSDPVDKRGQIKKNSKSNRNSKSKKSSVANNLAKSRKKSLTDVISFSKFWKTNKSDSDHGGNTGQTHFYTVSDSDQDAFEHEANRVGNALFYNTDKNDDNQAKLCDQDSDSDDGKKDATLTNRKEPDKFGTITREGAFKSKGVKKRKGLSYQPSMSGFDGVKTYPVTAIEFSGDESEHDESTRPEYNSSDSDDSFDEANFSRGEHHLSSDSGSCHSGQTSEQVPSINSQLPPPKDKVHRIALELLETEQSYVAKLHLIYKVFHDRIRDEIGRKHWFSEDTLREMFPFIEGIYSFHHDTLLPTLEKTLLNWLEEPNLGSVMRQYAPFLKLTNHYVVNFDAAMKSIQHWLDKCEDFKSLILKLQKTPECMFLTLQHHMLSPVQRIPRYKLLLSDYLKHLPEESPDYQAAKEALQSVDKAATEANESMKKSEKFSKLLYISEQLGGTIDLVHPSRELVKEGKVIKISASKGNQHERYLFLFNDLIILCQALMGLKVSYKVKSRMSIEGLEVLDGNNLAVPDTILIKSREITVELHFSDHYEKTEWQEAILGVIRDYLRKKKSRLDLIECDKLVEGEGFGTRAPVWVKDASVSMCMLCCSDFGHFFRKHHCRCCGKVICKQCSTHRAHLDYVKSESKLNRVCDPCYTELQNRNKKSASDTLQSSMNTKHKKGKAAVLFVDANEGSLVSDYLQYSQNCKHWKKRWMAVRKDLVLYAYKAHQDVLSLCTIPLPGYIIEDISTKDSFIFKLYHKHQTKVYYYQAENHAMLKNWTTVLEKVTRLELPE